MKDLIKRTDAIKALGERPLNWCGTPEECQAENDWDMYKSAIEAIPSAENKGEWKHLEGDEWLCSECGHVIWTEGSWEHPLERGKDYCEHCGAHMKGAGDE